MSAIEVKLSQHLDEDQEEALSKFCKISKKKLTIKDTKIPKLLRIEGLPLCEFEDLFKDIAEYDIDEKTLGSFVESYKKDIIDEFVASSDSRFILDDPYWLMEKLDIWMILYKELKKREDYKFDSYEHANDLMKVQNLLEMFVSDKPLKVLKIIINCIDPKKLGIQYLDEDLKSFVESLIESEHRKLLKYFYKEKFAEITERLEMKDVTNELKTKIKKYLKKKK